MLSTYIFDSKSKRYRYRDPSKGFVKNLVINNFKKRIAAKSDKEISLLKEKYSNGSINLLQFLSKFEDILSYTQISVTALFSGGLNNNPILGDAIDHINLQRDYLVDLFRKKEAGLITDKQFEASLSRYREDSITQGEAIADHALEIRSGKQYAYRLLGDAEHCPSCERYYLRGVQRTVDLAPPKTGCECTSRCGCTILYFDNFQAAMASKLSR
jgi:hypothetical protein